MLKHWKLGLVAASLLVGGVALAQPSGGGAKDQDASAHHKRDGKRGEKRAAMLGKYDTNKDGKLDAAEKVAMQKDKFARLDKNHDGVLSFDEAQPLMAHHRGGRGFHRGGGDNKQ